MGTTAPPHGLMGTSDFFYFFILKEKMAPRLQLQARDALQSALLHRRHHPRIRSFLGTAETFSGKLSFKKNILREIGTQEISFQWATNETATGFASFLNNTLSMRQTRQQERNE